MDDQKDWLTAAEAEKQYNKARGTLVKYIWADQRKKPEKRKLKLM